MQRKTERLFRIAGVDPQAVGRVPLSDALVKAIAQEASDVAGQFLNICIRAIDYCPPADMELGEYLRAHDHRRRRSGAQRQVGLPRSADALVPAPRDLSRSRAVHDRGRGALAVARSDAWSIPGLAFRELRFDGEPGQPASADELDRQAHALGRFVTDPAHADVFQLVAPGARLPKDVVQASPPMVQSVRVTRRAAPDGRVVFDLVAEVTQSCTVHRGRRPVRHERRLHGRDRPGRRRALRHLQALRQRGRPERQHAAMRGPLKGFWKKSGSTFKPRQDVLQLLHGSGRARAGERK